MYPLHQTSPGPVPVQHCNCKNVCRQCRNPEPLSYQVHVSLDRQGPANIQYNSLLLINPAYKELGLNRTPWIAWLGRRLRHQVHSTNKCNFEHLYHSLRGILTRKDPPRSCKMQKKFRAWIYDYYLLTSVSLSSAPRYLNMASVIFAHYRYTGQRWQLDTVLKRHSKRKISRGWER